MDGRRLQRIYDRASALVSGLWTVRYVDGTEASVTPAGAMQLLLARQIVHVEERGPHSGHLAELMNSLIVKEEDEEHEIGRF